MKSYEQVTRELLVRRDEYERTHRRRSRAALCTAALCAAVICIGVLGWRNGTAYRSQTSGVEANSQVELVSSDDHKTNDKIVFNKVDSISQTNAFIALMVDDFVEMTCEELIEYYGADIEPDVPEDLMPEESDRYGVFRRDGGTGEVYYDNNRLSYANGDKTRYVHVEASKGKVPFSCCGLDYDCFDKSVIRGVDVMMFKTDLGFGTAEFVAGGAGFSVNYGGLSDEEFVDIVTSLIEKNQIQKCGEAE